MFLGVSYNNAISPNDIPHPDIVKSRKDYEYTFTDPVSIICNRTHMVPSLNIISPFLTWTSKKILTYSNIYFSFHSEKIILSLIVVAMMNLTASDFGIIFLISTWSSWLSILFSHLLCNTSLFLFFPSRKDDEEESLPKPFICINKSIEGTFTFISSVSTSRKFVITGNRGKYHAKIGGNIMAFHYYVRGIVR